MSDQEQVIRRQQESAELTLSLRLAERSAARAEALLRELAVARKDCAERDRQVRDLRQHLQAAEARLEQGELDRSKATALQEQLHFLQRQLETTRQELKERQQRVEQLESRCDSLMEGRRDSPELEGLRSLVHLNEWLRGRVERAETQAVSSEQHFRRACELEQELQTSRSSLRETSAALQQARARLAPLERERDEALRRLKAEQQALREMESRLTRAQRELEETRLREGSEAPAEQEKVEDPRLDVEQVQRLKVYYEQARRTVGALRGQLRERDARLEEAEAARQAAEAANEAAKSAALVSEMAARSAEAAAKAAAEDRQAMESRSRALRLAVADRERRLASLSSEVEQLGRQLQAAREENARLQSALETAWDQAARPSSESPGPPRSVAWTARSRPPAVAPNLVLRPWPAQLP